MNEKVRLSKRLKAIASFLPKQAYFADIGTDHAFLPSFVCLKDKYAKAIAGDVKEGPYKAACKTIQQYGLSQKIDIRLGNGLEVIQEDPIRQVVIAGMGGSLITKILEAGKTYLKTVERIIAQPNIGEKNVRKWFYQNGYIITEETMINENGHLYEVIVADKCENADLSMLDEKALLFGPVLLQNKNELFYEKWKNQQKKVKHILENYQQAVQQDDHKITELTSEISLIKEVLSGE